MLFRAPRTSFNASLTPRRSVAFTAVPLSDVKDIKDAYGVKVNDVIVAVTAEAVRRYLDMRGELPAKPLVAAEPISVHGRRPASGGTTRLTVMFSTMATDEKKPDERLRAIAAANAQAKEGSELMGADTLMRWSEYVWCYGYELGVRIYSSLHLADHHPVAYNLVLSNVAGPPVTLYLAEARCTEIFPFGPLFEGAGLNVTVISSDDRVGFGFIACPDLVSDVWAMADAVPGALNELRASVRRRSRVVASATGRSRSTRRRSYAT